MDTTIKVLVVGASRGIGAELVKQFARLPHHEIIAAVRDKKRFTDGDNIKYVTMDMNSAASVSAAAEGVGSLDILIISAAIGDEEKIETTTEDRLLQYLDSNVIGPHRIIQAFIPSLIKGSCKKIIFVSSTSGSLTKQSTSCTGFAGPYSVSKAAGNMLVIQYQNDLRTRGFCVVAVHPGWVDTDMGRRSGDGGIPVTQSVDGLRKLILGVTPEDGARFFNYDGSSLPW